MRDDDESQLVVIMEQGQHHPEWYEPENDEALEQAVREQIQDEMANKMADPSWYRKHMDEDWDNLDEILFLKCRQRAGDKDAMRKMLLLLDESYDAKQQELIDKGESNGD